MTENDLSIEDFVRTMGRAYIACNGVDPELMSQALSGSAFQIAANLLDEGRTIESMLEDFAADPKRNLPFHLVAVLISASWLLDHAVVIPTPPNENN